MLYLVGSTHADKAYTIQKCAQFSHNPRKSHEVGVKYIARYLKMMKTKGVIMAPDKRNMRIDVYADTDFLDFILLKITWIRSV